MTKTGRRALNLLVERILGQAGDRRFAGDKPAMLPVPGMKAILLGKHSVTVEEYGRLVDNGGYGEERFWRDSWSIEAKEGRDTP